MSNGSHQGAAFMRCKAFRQYVIATRGLGHGISRKWPAKFSRCASGETTSPISVFLPGMPEAPGAQAFRHGRHGLEIPHEQSLGDTAISGTEPGASFPAVEGERSTEGAGRTVPGLHSAPAPIRPSTD